MRRFAEALHLAEKPNSETMSENSVANGGGLGVTLLDDVVLSSPEKHDVLLHIDATAAHIPGQNRYAASIDARSTDMPPRFSLGQNVLHRTACVKHLVSLRDALLSETLQTTAL